MNNNFINKYKGNAPDAGFYSIIKKKKHMLYSLLYVDPLFIKRNLIDIEIYKIIQSNTYDRIITYMPDIENLDKYLKTLNNDQIINIIFEKRYTLSVNDILKIIKYKKHGVINKIRSLIFLDEQCINHILSLKIPHFITDSLNDILIIPNIYSMYVSYGNIELCQWLDKFPNVNKTILLKDLLLSLKITNDITFLCNIIDNNNALIVEYYKEILPHCAYYNIKVFKYLFHKYSELAKTILYTYDEHIYKKYELEELYDLDNNLQIKIDETIICHYIEDGKFEMIKKILSIHCDINLEYIVELALIFYGDNRINDILIELKIINPDLIFDNNYITYILDNDSYEIIPYILYKLDAFFLINVDYHVNSETFHDIFMIFLDHLQSGHNVNDLDQIYQKHKDYIDLSYDNNKLFIEVVSYYCECDGKYDSLTNSTMNIDNKYFKWLLANNNNLDITINNHYAFNKAIRNDCYSIVSILYTIKPELYESQYNDYKKTRTNNSVSWDYYEYSESSESDDSREEYIEHIELAILPLDDPEKLKNNECVICYNESSIITGCGHYFCEQCLDKSLSIKINCAYCRQDILTIYKNLN